MIQNNIDYDNNNTLQGLYAGCVAVSFIGISFGFYALLHVFKNSPWHPRCTIWYYVNILIYCIPYNIRCTVGLYRNTHILYHSQLQAYWTEVNVQPQESEKDCKANKAWYKMYHVTPAVIYRTWQSLALIMIMLISLFEIRRASSHPRQTYTDNI